MNLVYWVVRFIGIEGRILNGSPGFGGANEELRSWFSKDREYSDDEEVTFGVVSRG